MSNLSLSAILSFCLSFSSISVAFAAVPTVQWPQAFEGFDSIFLRGYRLRFEHQQTPMTCLPAIMRIVHQHYTGRYVTECRTGEKITGKNYCYDDGSWIDDDDYIADVKKQTLFRSMQNLGYRVEYIHLKKLAKDDTAPLTKVIQKLGENKIVTIISNTLESKNDTHIQIITGVKRDKKNRVSFEIYDPGIDRHGDFQLARRSDFFFGYEPVGIMILEK